MLSVLLALALASTPATATPTVDPSFKPPPKARNSAYSVYCVATATSARNETARPARWPDTALVGFKLASDGAIDWDSADISWTVGPGDDAGGASFDYASTGPATWKAEPKAFGAVLVAPLDLIQNSRVRIVADGELIYEGPADPPVGINLASIDFKQGASDRPSAPVARVINAAHRAAVLDLALFNAAGAKLAETTILTGVKDRRDPLLRKAMTRAIDAARGVRGPYQADCR